ncbi:MAG: ATPase [Ruminococcus sp.]|nr:ATPase [Ruminococcus sp.]
MGKTQPRLDEYFLGAVTPGGFSTEFSKVMNEDGYFTFILKGGAGTGKSSLMKRIAAELPGDKELYHCSSDPESLDAVVVKDKKVIVVDGTAPHTFDPEVPAIKQVIVNLGDFWNEKKLLSGSEAVLDAMKLNRSYMGRAKRYVCALTDICFDTYSLGSEALDLSGIKALASRLCARVITGKGSGTGKTRIRQLSAVTMQGLKTYEQTIENCTKVYRFSDEYFAASSHLFDELAAKAAAKGYDVIVCPTQLLSNDVTEHIIIPELDLAFVSVNKLKGDIGTGRTTSLAKYYDESLMTLKAPRLKLNRTASKTLLDEAAKTLTLAKQSHDEIEKYYIAAMDFKRLDKAADKLIERIAKRKV